MKNIYVFLFISIKYTTIYKVNLKPIIGTIYIIKDKKSQKVVLQNQKASVISASLKLSIFILAFYNE